MNTQTVQTEKTRIYNHFSNGWTGETNTAEEGEGWQITTLKRYGGKISTIAKRVTFNPSGGVTFDMFGAKTINLITTTGRATEKTIKEQHARALILFDEHPEAIQEAQKPVYKIEVGQRVFLDGYNKGQFDGNKIIYAIEKTNWGINYLAVDTQTLELSVESHIKDFSEKFGIGIYYIQGDKFTGTTDELNNFVIEAKLKEAKELERAESERLLQAQSRIGKIEEGKKLISIPENAKAVIVAELYEDESDSQSDYFNTSVKKSVILGYSITDRNNMQELKKACLNFEETAEFAQGGAEFEHTDGHSYLPNYFLGSSRWSGWKVNKNKYSNYNPTTEQGKEEIYIAVAEGRYFVANEPEQEKKTFENLTFENIEIVDYSEKAIAVIGDTKPIKDELKALGGRFNFRLTCGAGWIFPKTKITEVELLIKGAN
jgi:hypothetical protein